MLTLCCISDNVCSASYLNPLNWVKEKLVPSVREKQAKEEVEAGKQQATEEGRQSVFETVPTPSRKKELSKSTSVLGMPGTWKPVKPRPTSVRCPFNDRCCSLIESALAQIFYCQFQNFPSKTEHAR